VPSSRGGPCKRLLPLVLRSGAASKQQHVNLERYARVSGSWQLSLR
jgi:hypothetical protein